MGIKYPGDIKAEKKKRTILTLLIQKYYIREIDNKKIVMKRQKDKKEEIPKN